jgi:LAO/AO transport system kinase
VGQAEIDIASAAHTTIVVEAPGLGDEVQAIKAGVLEIADLFAVNKADREGADHTVMALQMMQGLAPSPDMHHRPDTGRGPAHAQPGPQSDKTWLPPIVKTVAMRGEGVEVLRDWIEKHAAYLHGSEQLRLREELRAASELDHILREALLASLVRRMPGNHLKTMAESVARREVDPYSAVDQILTTYGCVNETDLAGEGGGCE